MKHPGRMAAIAGVLLLWLAGWGAAAGVVIEQEQREPGSNAPASRTSLYLDAGRLRVEARSADGEHTITIFDEGKQVVWMIDRAAGTYVEMTTADVQKMRQRIEQARKEMEAELARMPPEQRQRIEEMMKQQWGGGGEITARETGRGEAVGGFTCTRYELLQGAERTAEVWAAPFEQVQLREPEIKTFQALGRFLEPLGQRGQAGAGWVGGAPQVQGFPVRTLTYDGERVVAEEKVLKAERRSLEASLFALPPGLEKSEFGPE